MMHNRLVLLELPNGSLFSEGYTDMLATLMLKLAILVYLEVVAISNVLLVTGQACMFFSNLHA